MHRKIVEPFKDQAAEVLKRIKESLAKDDELTFTQTVLQVAMAPGDSQHDSTTEPVYYNALIDALLDSIQEPTVKNIVFATALDYLERIEWAGFGPVFRFNSVLPSSELVDLDLIFNVYCQDDKVLPHSRLVARFSVSAEDGKFTTLILDDAFLKSTIINEGVGLNKKKQQQQQPPTTKPLQKKNPTKKKQKVPA